MANNKQNATIGDRWYQNTNATDTLSEGSKFIEENFVEETEETKDENVVDNNESEFENAAPESETPAEESEEATPAEESKEESTDDNGSSNEEPTHDYKKRYDDLKRHYDTKISELKNSVSREEFDRITKELEEAKANPSLPTSKAQLEEFKKSNPDMYNIVIALAQEEASKNNSGIAKEIEELKKAKAEAEFEKGMQKISAKHPDAESLRKSDKFLSWFEKQPAKVKGLFTEGATVDDVISGLDYYKLTTGKAKDEKEAKKEAAKSSTSGNKSDASTKPSKDEKVWKESEIADLYEKGKVDAKLEEQINGAFAKGMVILDVSGGTR
jgi:hypothetical protein